MRRARTVLTEVGGFGVAAAAISIACSFAVIVALPDPPAARMTVAAAAAALRGARVEGLAASEGAPPEGSAAPLVETILAHRLGVPRARVRAVWADPTARAPGGPARPPERVILVRRGAAGAMMPIATPLPPALLTALATAPQPAFVAALRSADGRWRRVAPARSLLSGWRLRVLAALLACLALIAPVTWLFARRLTRPFRLLAAQHGEAVPPEGPLEVRAAVSAIAAMRDRLAAESRERVRMLAAVAHDLRTPLTGLRLRAETAPAAARDRMVADIARMEAMIAEVLAYARGGPDRRGVVAVRPLLAAIVAEARESGAAVTLGDGGDAAVLADPAHLRRAVENLVRNAVDHAGGGRVTLAATADIAAITVADTGPGIAPADRARLLLPVARGDASRNRDTGGTGLGLGIVADFAERHGGRFTLADNGGRGTAATLSLPCRDDQASAG